MNRYDATGNEPNNPLPDPRYFIPAVLIAILVLLFLMAKVVKAEDIDYDRLVAAVIQVESNGNPNAVSKCGAVGLMQITPIVLKEFNLINASGTYHYEDLFISGYNIHIGTWYLHRLAEYYLKYFFNNNMVIILNETGSEILYTRNLPSNTMIKNTYNIRSIDEFQVAFISAAYNGGITRLKNCNYDINCMPKETRDYVKKVLKLYKGASK